MNIIQVIKSFIGLINKNCIKIASIVLIPKAIKTALKCNQIISENNRNIAIIVLTEHIGDIIASQPVSEYLVKKENKKIIWIVNEKFENIVRLIPSISYIIPVSCLSEWIYARQLVSRDLEYNLHYNGRCCAKFCLTISNVNKEISMENYYSRGNLLKMFFDLANLPYSDKKPKLLIPAKQYSPLKVPKNYFVIHTSSNEACRNWDTEKWTNFIKMHPHENFIEIGLTPTLKDIPNCNSTFCGRTTFEDIIFILSKSKGFIGIDSSMAHIANALNCRSIIILGKYRNFDKYMPFSGIFENRNFHILQKNGVMARDICVNALNEIFEKMVYDW